MNELNQFISTLEAIGCTFERRDNPRTDITVIQISDVDFTFVDGEFVCATSRTTEEMMIGE